jgi:outer membrane protein OmpA-like peptidoglycan-associated protein
MKTKFYSNINNYIVTVFFSCLLLTATGLYSQTKYPQIKRTRPTWWVGESIAANFNFYQGTTQQLSETVSVPTAFHNGQGVRLYFSFLAEYRKSKVWGAALNVAFNNRSSSFDGVLTPGNQRAYLYTVLRYVNIEPSIRIAPFSSAFYIFTGPTLSINTTKEFFYEQEGQHETRGNWSELRKYVFGLQAGAGVDIPISSKTAANQLTISPFASFLPNFFNNPRRIESWNIYTFRTGVALKFGTHKTVAPTSVSNTAGGTVLAQSKTGVKTDSSTGMVPDIQVSVQVPKIPTALESVREIFPLRNSIFFNEGSTVIPDRYIKLSQSEASAFAENELQQNRAVNWYNSQGRQLYVYHHILNILGDRLRTYPQSTISLLTNPKDKSSDAHVMADNIKNYLVTNFSIDAARINTEDNSNAFISSLEPRDVNNLSMRQMEDRRVDIITLSPELLSPFGSTVSKNGVADGRVLFMARGASSQLQSWSIDLKDEQGVTSHYGPFTADSASLSSKTILGNKGQGNYTFEMVGHANNGGTIRREGVVSLFTTNNLSAPVLRYSVLFDFDRSEAVTASQKFLTDVVAPLVTDSSVVTIYGHTDVIGNEKYNLALSSARVTSARQILENVLNAKGKKAVKLRYYGFGENGVMSPYNNDLPEERFYNRTVIIEIVQPK